MQVLLIANIRYDSTDVSSFIAVLDLQQPAVVLNLTFKEFDWCTRLEMPFRMEPSMDAAYVSESVHLHITFSELRVYPLKPQLGAPYMLAKQGH